MNRPNWGRAIWLLVGLAVSAGVVVEAAFPDAHKSSSGGLDGTRFQTESELPTTQEQWINTDRGQKLHLARKDLVLNGPIDNPAGSCTSCHGFAQVPNVNIRCR